MFLPFIVGLCVAGVSANSSGVGVNIEGNHFVIHPSTSNNNFDSFAQYSRNVSGWNYLDVTTVKSINVDDHLKKLKGSGIAEGYLSCEDLRTSYPNFYADNFGNEPPPSEFIAFIIENYLWMIEESERNAATSEYWLTVKSMLYQLQGLLDGYLNSPCLQSTSTKIENKPFTSYGSKSYLESVDLSPSNDNITLLHLLLLNSWGDIYSITSKYESEKKLGLKVNTQNKQTSEDTSLLTKEYLLNRRRISYPKTSSAGPEIQRDLRCSSLFKILPDYSDIYFGHATWGSYIALAPRIFKRYELPVALKPLSSEEWEVELRTNSFSSSPALLASLDDFYVISSTSADLVVIETTNDMMNPSLHSLITPQHNLCWMRVLVANTLATSGETWSTNFGYLNSGTYTNQWQVMDMSLFTPGTAPVQPGFFTLLEEVPGTVVYKDVTQVLLNMTYWGSYNVPYFPDISVKSGNKEACDVMSEHNNDTDYCWINAPRASIFRQRHSDINTLSDFQYLINFNDWQHDPLSVGDACKSIACRRDLETDPTLIYPSGGLDAKVSSYTMSRGAHPVIKIRNGPTTDNQIPFCWSSLNETYVHLGQPDCFNFSWLSVPSLE